MPKVLLLLFILPTLLIPFIFPNSVEAQVALNCQSDAANYFSKVEFPLSVPLNQAFDIRVWYSSQIPKSTFQVHVSDDHGLVGFGSVDRDSPELPLPYISGLQPVPFTIQGIDHVFGSYHVTMRKNGSQICDFGHLAVVDQVLATTTCDLTMPLIIHRGDEFTMFPTVTQSSGLTYSLYIALSSDVSRTPIGKVVSGNDVSNVIGKAVFNKDFSPPDQPVTFTVADYNGKANGMPGINYSAIIRANRGTDPTSIFCKKFDFTMSNQPTSQIDNCKIIPPNPDITSNVKIQALSEKNGMPFTVGYGLSAYYTNDAGGTPSEPTSLTITSQGPITIDLASHLAVGNYTATVYQSDTGRNICDKKFSVTEKLVIPSPPGGGIGGPTGCTGDNCTKSGGERCNPSDGKPDPNGTGTFTAIGCIPSEPAELIKGLATFLTGAGGGVALLLMIYGAFQMITSAGNPDTLKDGQQRMIAAGAGLLFIILAVLILKIIGVDILQIPGFTK